MVNMSVQLAHSSDEIEVVAIEVAAVVLPIDSDLVAHTLLGRIAESHMTYLDPPLLLLLVEHIHPTEVPQPYVLRFVMLLEGWHAARQRLANAFRIGFVNSGQRHSLPPYHGHRGDGHYRPFVSPSDGFLESAVIYWLKMDRFRTRK